MVNERYSGHEGEGVGHMLLEKKGDRRAPLIREIANGYEASVRCLCWCETVENNVSVRKRTLQSPIE
jgi:hypothetical protein